MSEKKLPKPEVVQAVLTLYADQTDQDLTLIEHDGSGGLPRMAIMVARNPLGARRLADYYAAETNGNPWPTPLPRVTR